MARIDPNRNPWLPEEPRSRPLRVEFCGFESDVARLAQAGWKISIEEDFESSSAMSRETRILFANDKLNLVAFAQNPVERGATFLRIAHVTPRVEYVTHEQGLPMESRFVRIEDAHLGGVPLAHVKEIITAGHPVFDRIYVPVESPAPSASSIATATEFTVAGDRLQIDSAGNATVVEEGEPHNAVYDPFGPDARRGDRINIIRRPA